MTETSEAMSDATQRLPLRRIRRPVWIVAAVALTLIALAVSFFSGRFLAAPTRDALQEANEPIPVTAEVEMRVVDDRATVTGAIVAGDAIVVQPMSLPEQPIVTRQPLSPGSQVTAGALLGVVAGTPVFGLPGPVPLYRDLRAGDIGDDVRALQVALAAAGYAVQPTGTLGDGAIAAVRALYEAAGVPMLQEPMPQSEPTSVESGGEDAAESSAPVLMRYVIPRAAFVALPAPTTTVIDSAGVGSLLSEERPLVRVATSGPTATVRADPLAVDAFAIDTAVIVQVAGQQFPGTVVSVGDFQTAEGGVPPGRDVRIAVDDPAFTSTAVGTPLSVTLAATTLESLAVPSIALREDAEGTYLLLPAPGDAEGPTRLDVTVIRLGGGWAAVEAVGLEPGALVLVS